MQIWDWGYCNDCHSWFMGDDILYTRNEERHFWLDDCPTEVTYEAHCPDCGSSNIEEADYCDECGEVMIPGDSPDGLCNRCRDKIEKEMERESNGKLNHEQISFGDGRDDSGAVAGDCHTV